LQEKNFMTAHVWYCRNRACHLSCFLSASVKRKDLQFSTWKDPSFQWQYWFHPMTSGS
jgi:hypothetical protein